MSADITLPFEKGSHVLFIGDSITDAGRLTDKPPYGGGYVSLIQALVTAEAPELGLRWSNRGISGNTVRDLAGRWQADVLDERPDWLCVKIGINDCWRGVEGKTEEAVPVGEFQETLAALLDRAVAATGCRVVLATPTSSRATGPTRGGSSPTVTWPPPARWRASGGCRWSTSRRPSTACSRTPCPPTGPATASTRHCPATR